MRNWNYINEVGLDYLEDEVQEVEQYVKERKGRIIWGFMAEAVERGDKIIKNIWYVNKEGIFCVPLSDI